MCPFVLCTLCSAQNQKINKHFTIRRILHKLGGIQSIVALPGDSNFNSKDAKYDKPSFERLCKEFKTPNTNFFFEKGANHGLGHIYAYGIKVPDSVNKWPGYKFSDEGGAASCGCLIDKIKAEDIKQSSILLKVN